MKHIIVKAICICLVMSIFMSINSLAVYKTDEVDIYSFEYEGNTIEINADGITYEQAQIVAEKLIYGDSESSTYGILCLFGHKIDTTVAVQINHKYYDASPRCLKKTYQVDYCTRSSCTYSNATLITSMRISCCLED